MGKLSTSPAGIQIKDVSVHYGSVAALDHVSLEVREGEFLALLGPSGSGKTTLLRVLGGLVDADEGDVFIGDRLCTHVPPFQRSIGMVFQDYALFPHMTVFQNVAFGLKMHRVSGPELKERVEEALALLDLKRFADRYPRQLSGGQQQRVALARAIVLKPSVLLLDESLSALDRKLREEMQVEIRQLQQRLGITTVFVTHDQEEALTMADRIAVMDGGQILQLGAPNEIYERPASRFISTFIGKCNLLRVTVNEVRNGVMTCSTTGDNFVTVPRDTKAQRGDEMDLGVRPERIRLSAAKPDTATLNFLPGTVLQRIYVGVYTRYDIDCGDGQQFVAVELNKVDGERSVGFKTGDRVHVTWDPADSLVLHMNAPKE